MATPEQEEPKPEEQNEQLQESQTEEKVEKYINPELFNDDQEEIDELLANNHSSKTWESKCLIGKPPKDKTSEDEKIIVDYYDSVLEPAVQKRLKK